MATLFSTGDTLHPPLQTQQVNIKSNSSNPLTTHDHGLATITASSLPFSWVYATIAGALCCATSSSGRFDQSGPIPVMQFCRWLLLQVGYGACRARKMADSMHICHHGTEKLQSWRMLPKTLHRDWRRGYWSFDAVRNNGREVSCTFAFLNLAVQPSVPAFKFQCT